jgi:hypothetical protein
MSTVKSEHLETLITLLIQLLYDIDDCQRGHYTHEAQYSKLLLGLVELQNDIAEEKEE